jgi:hypothetical protein
LEHVPDILEFVKGIAAVLSDDGLSLIEVPDADWVLTNLFAHEIWDEHISYFRAQSLAKLIKSCGLNTLRLERMRFQSTRNLLCWSTPASVRDFCAERLVSDEASFETMGRFQARWDLFSERLRSLVLSTAKPIIAIGAGHAQLNFINFTGLGALVDTLIDDDKSKAGRFAPLTKPVPIKPTVEILATVRKGTLLRTAFSYRDWEDHIESVLSSYNVRSIDPYDVLASPQ